MVMSGFQQTNVRSSSAFTGLPSHGIQAFAGMTTCSDFLDGCKPVSTGAAAALGLLLRVVITKTADLRRIVLVDMDLPTEAFVRHSLISPATKLLTSDGTIGLHL